MPELPERCYFLCGELATVDSFDRAGRPVRACERCKRLHGGIEGQVTLTDRGEFYRRWHSGETGLYPARRRR